MADEGPPSRAPTTVSVDLGPRSYDILIGRGVIRHAGAEIAARLPNVRAAVVTDETGRILVIRRRDNGAWQIPGGILEPDETVQDGVRREVEEETGVTVEPQRLTGVYKNMRLGVVALVFRARVVAGTPHPTAESTAVSVR